MLSKGLTAFEIMKKLQKTRTVSDDLKFGCNNEINVLKYLNCEFDDVFRNTKDIYGDKYFNYDFEGVNTHKKIEMKSRRVKHDTYPTTIVPVHKCKNINAPDAFVFQFTDGIYYIENDLDKFNNYEVKNVVSNRIDKNECKYHYHIPVTDLKRMNC